MNLPTIKALRVRAVNAPLLRPVRTASGALTSAALVLLDLETDANVTGCAYIFTVLPAAAKPTALLIQNMAEWIAGDVIAPIDIHAKLSARTRLMNGTGIATTAIAAIDMALWDALSKFNSLPLAAQLGSTPKPIKAYASFGLDGPEEGVRLAEEALQKGFLAVKTRVGFASVADDVDTIEAFVDELPDELAIMCDFNQSLTPVEAIRRCRRLESYDLTWIEEPVLADDYEGCAKVAREIATPIQIGENCWSPREVERAIRTQSSDYLMIDVCKIGGITPWLRAAALAEAAQIPFSSHIFHEVSAHLLCAAPTAHYLEHLPLAESILAEHLQIKDGCAIPSSAPGSGIVWDEAAIQKFLI